MSAKFSHIPRSRQHDNTPPSNEKKIFAALERYFKGAEWVGPPSASTSTGESGSQPHRGSFPTPDALPSGGTGAYNFVVIGASKYDLKKFKGWLRKLGSDTRFVTGSGKRGPEELLLELRSDTEEWELRSDLYGPRARDAQVEALVGQALVGATLVLVGTGARVTLAKNVLKRLGQYAPTPLELP